MTCPNCGEKWHHKSENAIAIEVLGQCLKCRKITPADIAKVSKAKRERQMIIAR